MTEEDFFVRFHNMRGNKVMELTAERPIGLIRKIMENAEAIESLKYDHHTTNMRSKFEEAGNDE